MTPLPTTDAAIGAAVRTGKSTAPEGMPSSPRTIPKAEPRTAAAATHRTGDRPGDKPQSRPIVPQGTDTTSATKTAQPSQPRRPHPIRPFPPPSGLIASQLLRPYPNPHSGFPHHDRLIAEPSQPARSAHPLQPDPHRDHPTAEPPRLRRPKKSNALEPTTPGAYCTDNRPGSKPQSHPIDPQGTDITSATETAEPLQLLRSHPKKAATPEPTTPAAYCTDNRPGDKPQNHPIYPQRTNITSAAETAQPSQPRRPHPDFLHRDHPTAGLSQPVASHTEYEYAATHRDHPTAEATRQPRPQKTNAPERTAPANRALFAATNPPPPNPRSATGASHRAARNQWLPSPGRRTAPAGRAAAGKGGA